MKFSSGSDRSVGSCSSSDSRNSVNSDSFGSDSDSDCIVAGKILTVLLQVIKGTGDEHFDINVFRRKTQKSFFLPYNWYGKAKQTKITQVLASPRI